MRREMLAVTLAAVVFAALLAGAGEEDRNAVVAGNNAFAFDLYGELRGSDGDLFFSPYSVSTALAMTWAGARGETAGEMARVLRFPFDGARLHRSLAALTADLNDRRAKARWNGDEEAGRRLYELVVANHLWGQEGYPFRRDFIRDLERYYGAGLTPVDFRGATEEARATINAWVAKQTRDKIEELLQKGNLTRDDRLVLTNAIYFKAAWEHAFRESATKEAPFHLASGETVDVPTMQKTEGYRVYRGDDVRVVSIPYMRNELAMVVVVPTEADGLPEVEEGLDAARLKGWLDRLRYERVRLSLPKFEVETRIKMRDVLRALGMRKAFVYGEADFSGMTGDRELFIGDVIHQAFVNVNEKGTEAAAATAVVMRAGGVPRPPQPFPVDRPFLFFIRDDPTGSILFIGRVTDPR